MLLADSREQYSAKIPLFRDNFGIITTDGC